MTVLQCIRLPKRWIKAMTVGLLVLSSVMLRLIIISVSQNRAINQMRYFPQSFYRENITSSTVRSRIYAYSVHIESEQNDRLSSKITISGWVHRSVNDTPRQCCIILNDDKILSTSAKTVLPAYMYWSAELFTYSHVCTTAVNSNQIKGVALELKDRYCPVNPSDYLKPIIHVNIKENGTIGLCAKFMYGNIDGHRLIEWFEFQKLVGVERIVAYEYELSSGFAMEVVRYYERDGFLLVIRGFEIPEKDSTPRRIGQRNVQIYSDVQVAVTDCTMRLKHFKYVAVMDIDEFMIPFGYPPQSSWKNFLEEQFKAPIGSIAFPGAYHLDFGTFNSSRLLMEQSTSGTVARFDNEKNIYMPERIQSNAVSVHEVNLQKGYERLFIDKEKAVTHHYRACRSEWKVPTKSVSMKKRDRLPKLCSESSIACSDFCQRPYPITQEYASAIDKNVQKVKETVLTWMYAKSSLNN